MFFVWFLFLFFFPFFALNRKTLFFCPPKRQLLFIYLCFPLFLFSLFWASPFFPFLFLCISLVLLFLPSFLFFISVSGSCFSFCVSLLLGSRFYFVFPFLIVVLFCFVSSCLIYFCFVSCFFVVVFFVLVAFIFCIFYFGYLSKNLSEKIGNCKKNRKCRKKRTFWQEQLAQVCWQIVSFFLSFLCFFKFFMFSWKHFKNRGFSQNKKKKNTNKNKQPSVKNWSKLALKTGPSMLHNKIGPVFNDRNGPFLFFFLLFFERSSSFCRENKIFKKKDQFLTQKRQ